MTEPPVILRIAGDAQFDLAPALRKVLRVLQLHHGWWNIAVVHDREMMELHQRTMAIPETTDVLTFDLRDIPPLNRKTKIKNRKSLDLDTVICVDEARRRAKDYGHRVRNELLLYCVHSLLHTLGYDDATAAQARTMHQREDEVLQAIGVGAVYARQMLEPPKGRRRTLRAQDAMPSQPRIAMRGSRGGGR